jgi:hypothetical protein
VIGVGGLRQAPSGDETLGISSRFRSSSRYAFFITNAFGWVYFSGRRG